MAGVDRPLNTLYWVVSPCTVFAAALGATGASRQRPGGPTPLYITVRQLCTNCTPTVEQNTAHALYCYSSLCPIFIARVVSMEDFCSIPARRSKVLELETVRLCGGIFAFLHLLSCSSSSLPPLLALDILQLLQWKCPWYCSHELACLSLELLFTSTHFSGHPSLNNSPCLYPTADHSPPCNNSRLRAR